MNYYKMWRALEKRLAKKKDEATDSFQLMLVDSVVEIMDEIEEEAEKIKEVLFESKYLP